MTLLFAILFRAPPQGPDFSSRLVVRLDDDRQ